MRHISGMPEIDFTDIYIASKKDAEKQLENAKYIVNLVTVFLN